MKNKYSISKNSNKVIEKSKSIDGHSYSNKTKKT